MDKELESQKVELPKSTIVQLYLSFKFACQEIEECSELKSSLNWYEVCWFKARQKMKTLAPEEREKLIKAAIEFEDLQHF
ncbi:MAG: hypothetical protein QNJ36_16820 [Calothrix sp. MO_167.B42]|nr:hypothetical protein [Calothrix sp. MO_167.B42]